MSRVTQLREIAANLSDTAEEARLYASRLAASGAADDRIKAARSVAKVLSVYSANYSQMAAAEAVGLAVADLKAIEEATKDGLGFLKTVKQVKLGLNLLFSIVNLAGAGIRGDVPEILSSVASIGTIIDEAVNDD